MQIVITSLFVITPNWKQPKCSPTDEQINKLWYVMHTVSHFLVLIEGANYLHVHQQGWISHILCKVKETMKSIDYVISLLWYSGIDKARDTERDQWLSGTGVGGWGWLQRGNKVFLRVRGSLIELFSILIVVVVIWLFVKTHRTLKIFNDF